MEPEQKNPNHSYIWTDLQAITRQHEQTRKSACGASAIINVLVCEYLK